MWVPFLTRVFPYIVFMLSLAMGLVALHNHAVNKGRKQVEGEWAIARAAQMEEQKKRIEESVEIERSLLLQINGLKKGFENEKVDANRRYAAVVAQLRDRKEARATATSGVPEAAGAQVGCTGEGLAGPDARFLARYAADAEQLAIGYKACMAAWGEAKKSF